MISASQGMVEDAPFLMLIFHLGCFFIGLDGEDTADVTDFSRSDVAEEMLLLFAWGCPSVFR
jgi:hypothetical protein